MGYDFVERYPNIKEEVGDSNPNYEISSLHDGTLVENMVNKNRNRFPIAVFLTTMICSH
jgi:hypothetical protein